MPVSQVMDDVGVCPGPPGRGRSLLASPPHGGERIEVRVAVRVHSVRADNQQKAEFAGSATGNGFV